MINKVFIIPDVHGRKFWEEMKDHIDDDTIDKFIFIGDYFDPYDDEAEYHSDDDCLSSFLEIMSIKEGHPDKVITLLGNHDIHYLYKNEYCSRHNDEREAEFSAVIKDNINNLDLMYIDDIECDNYDKVLFTHAGLTSGFLKTFTRAGYPKDDLNALCSDVNAHLKALKTHESHVLSDLMLRVSRYRGGNYADGSIVWADIREVVPNKFDYDNVYQIFGHTRAFFPTIMKRYAMLDTQECYIADFSERTITNTNTKKVFPIL